MNMLTTKPGNRGWKNLFQLLYTLSSDLYKSPAALIPHTINNKVNKI